MGLLPLFVGSPPLLKLALILAIPPLLFFLFELVPFLFGLLRHFLSDSFRLQLLNDFKPELKVRIVGPFGRLVIHVFKSNTKPHIDGSL